MLFLLLLLSPTTDPLSCRVDAPKTIYKKTTTSGLLHATACTEIFTGIF